MLVTFNTGKDWDNHKQRFKLNNKRYSYILSLVGVTIYKKNLVYFVRMKMNEFYKFNNDTKIIIYGDGAIWIKILALAINAIFVSDRFHPYKVLAKALVVGKNKRWNEYNKALDLFKNNKHPELINLLMDNKVDDSVLKYFKIIKIGMIYQNDPIINIGGSAESDVYHVVKSTCSGARIFSKQHFLNMLNKKIEKLNEK